MSITDKPMNNFWNDLPKPFYVLAPMEAVTDVIFRHVIAEAGRPDVFYTEFTNATGWVHAGEKAIGGRMKKTDQESPIVAQIWGGNPEDMAAFSLYCAELGFDGIDINMGCPAKSAIKSGGAALIRQPDLAVEAIAAAKTAGLPVSVKTRLGYSSIEEWHSWLELLLKQNIAALTIHLRTKKEMSKVPAHHELIPDIKALRDTVAPETLLIVNGDIADRWHGNKLAKKHGIDGVMIGRGVFHDPFCFSAVVHSDRKSELINLMRYHLKLFDEYRSITGRPYDTLKRFFKIYIRDFDGAAEARDRLMHTISTDEALAIIDEL